MPGLGAPLTAPHTLAAPPRSALKTVLGIAGRELRDARKAGQTVDAEVEAEIIIRSVAATKLPTLTFDDNSRFK
jgi:dynein heavy chain 2